MTNPKPPTPPKYHSKSEMRRIETMKDAPPTVTHSSQKCAICDDPHSSYICEKHTTPPIAAEREWTLVYSLDYLGYVAVGPTEKGPNIPVIERSAVTRLEAELARMNRECISLFLHDQRMDAERERAKALLEVTELAILHLKSMDNYSVVSGAINWLEGAIAKYRAEEKECA
jgi:hypothetical protein